MYRRAHFFLTVDVSIKLEQLKVKIREELRRLGPDQDLGEVIPNGLVIQSQVVLCNAVPGLRFLPQTVINDQNIWRLLLFMEEKKSGTK